MSANVAERTPEPVTLPDTSSPPPEMDRDLLVDHCSDLLSSTRNLIVVAEHLSAGMQDLLALGQLLTEVTLSKAATPAKPVVPDVE